jgi:hypothetical protein
MLLTPRLSLTSLDFSEQLLDLRRCFEIEVCHTCEWVVSHVWMSHVSRVNESCHTYEWVMSHVWMSQVTHMNEWFHAYEWVVPHLRMSRKRQERDPNKMSKETQICTKRYGWVMSRIWISRATSTNESRHAYEWVVSHIWMSRVAHMNESGHAYGRVMSRKIHVDN